MASLIYLDTHVIAWLYAGQTERIPAAARKAINQSELLISPMVLVELQYLIEIGRFTDPVEQVLEVLGRDLGLKVCDLQFFRHCASRVLHELDPRSLRSAHRQPGILARGSPSGPSQ